LNITFGKDLGKSKAKIGEKFDKIWAKSKSRIPKTSNFLRRWFPISMALRAWSQ